MKEVLAQPLWAGNLLTISHGGARILQYKLIYPQSEAEEGEGGHISTRFTLCSRLTGKHMPGKMKLS